MFGRRKPRKNWRPATEAITRNEANHKKNQEAKRVAEEERKNTREKTRDWSGSREQQRREYSSKDEDWSTQYLNVLKARHHSNLLSSRLNIRMWRIVSLNCFEFLIHDAFPTYVYPNVVNIMYSYSWKPRAVLVQTQLGYKVGWTASASLLRMRWICHGQQGWSVTMDCFDSILLFSDYSKGTSRNNEKDTI